MALAHADLVEEDWTPPRPVDVRVSSDGLEAAVIRDPSLSGEVEISVGNVREALSAAGVVSGVDQASIAEAALGLSRGLGPATGYVVARGRAPQDGADASITYTSQLTTRSGRPSVNADGSVNLFDLQVVHSLAEDQVLATRTPPTEGVCGLTVRGVELPAAKGRDSRLAIGKGAALSADGTEVRSTVAGHASLVGDKIEVSQSFDVRSKVGPATGNINFAGAVHVQGDVLAGYRVQADGDVEVFGTVEAGATVEAGGDVNVRFGIVGQVRSGGSVKAAFLENAQVEAAANVWASGGILASTVDAGGYVEVVGPRGAIVGGCVTAREGITARALGSPANTRTRLRVGIAPAVLAEFKSVSLALKETQDQSERVLVGLRQLARLSAQGALPAAKSELAYKLSEVLAHLNHTQVQQSERQRTLASQISQRRAGYIQATHTAYPGVDLSIGSVRLQPDMETSHVRYVTDDQHLIQLAIAR
jgi:uncharacterized protein (DUF342 family)